MEKSKKLTSLISNKITSITHVFGILAIVIGALLLIYDARYLLSFGGGWDYINNIIVEAHGLFFDLLVLGVLISIYERRRQKKEAIERDKNLIEDFRGWDEKEAMFRIVGAVKRLNKLRVSKITLAFCSLRKASLSQVNLQDGILLGANLQEANLIEANLQHSNCHFVNFQGAKLQGAKLQGAELIEAYFKGANLQGANFQGNILYKAKLQGAQLNGASVGVNWFDELERWEVEGYQELVEKYFIDEKGIIREKPIAS